MYSKKEISISNSPLEIFLHFRYNRAVKEYKKKKDKQQGDL